MIKTLIVLGTRPEAIKLSPLIGEMKKRRERYGCRILSTGQQKEMLESTLSSLGIVPDRDLALMRPGQPIDELLRGVIRGTREEIASFRPDLVIVHGDTVSALGGALAALFASVPVAHIEAGLRTHDLRSPFPEEFDRRAIAKIASFHFAPTEEARDNLLAERVPENRIFVVGNTAADVLRANIRADFSHSLLSRAAEEGKKLVFLTAHRRENLGEKMNGIFRGIAAALLGRGDVICVFPMHKNPAVRQCAEAVFGNCPNVILTEPFDSVSFQNLLARAGLILTDSGGMQEEAAILGVPALVLRDSTERIEGLFSGALTLTGTDENAVTSTVKRALDGIDNTKTNEKRRSFSDLYGDGHTAERITEVLEKVFPETKKPCG